MPRSRNSFENPHDLLLVVHEQALGQFQFQAIGGKLHLMENAQNPIGQIWMPELSRRQIDRDRQRQIANLAAGLADHPVAHIDDQPGVLKEIDEIIGYLQPHSGCRQRNNASTLVTRWLDKSSRG